MFMLSSAMLTVSIELLGKFNVSISVMSNPGDSKECGGSSGEEVTELIDGSDDISSEAVNVLCRTKIRQ